MQTKPTDKFTIEMLNAHGPYDHGLWDPMMSGNTAHHKLSKSIVEQIYAEITSKYLKSQLAEMTILDVGGYDGWILVQLQQELNFKLAVCVEPRLKNIQKGDFARKYYGIQTNVKFIQGELNSLDQVLDNQFDFVLCLNVLHHVDSTPKAIQSLSRFCLDTIFISSAIITRPKRSVKKIEKLMNLKDIAYLITPKDFATAGFKFESPYFDGSTTESTIVNLPEENLIKMSLISNGFQVEKSVTSLASDNYKFFTKSHGELWGFVVANRKTSELNSNDRYLTDRIEYEKQFLFTLLKTEFIDLWLGKIHTIDRNSESARPDPLTKPSITDRLLFAASRKPNKLFSRFILRQSNLSSSEKSILQNVSKAPTFKIGFELANHNLKKGQHKQAKILFKDLTNKPSCDWRVFYRSCFFLTVIARIENDEVALVHYQQLLDIANPHFPISITEGVEWVLKAN